MENAVIYNEEENIAVITLNRPERRNSINRALLHGLYDSIDRVSSSDKIRACIITGSGKSFCSGIDLSVIGKEDLFNVMGDGRDFPDVIGACTKPVIAAVNGHAITGGFEIALNCDFMIASERAFFADTHVKVGIHPGWGMTQLLQQAVGVRMARQMSFTGMQIDAKEAFRTGLVNEVVHHDVLLNRAREIAFSIADPAHRMLLPVRELINFRAKGSLNDSRDHEREDFRTFVRENIKVQ